MAWHSLSNEAEIKRIFDFVIQRGTDIEVHIPGDEETYFSRFVEDLSGSGEDSQETWRSGNQLALASLSPGIGNHQIRTSPEVEICFPFRRFLCRFRSRFLFGSAMVSHQRLVIGYPGIVEVEEKRKEERLCPGSPDFLSAVIRLSGRNRDDRTYELSVIDYANHGLGLLVGEEDTALLEEIEPGDMLSGILLFGEALLLRISAVVRHKSEIHQGPNAGSFVVGLELEDGIEEQLDQIIC